jgi:hypothetical protein
MDGREEVRLEGESYSLKELKQKVELMNDSTSLGTSDAQLAIDKKVFLKHIKDYWNNPLSCDGEKMLLRH